MKNSKATQIPENSGTSSCPKKRGRLITICRKLLTKYQSIIIYLICGVLTTLVDYTIRFFLYDTSLNFHVVNIIGWVAAVIFAFVTNRRFVFHSRRSRPLSVLAEFLSFSGGRVISLGIQELLYEIGVSLCGIGEKMLMIPVSVLVIILNYFLGRLIFIGRKLSKSEDTAYPDED